MPMMMMVVEEEEEEEEEEGRERGEKVKNWLTTRSPPLL